MVALEESCVKEGEVAEAVVGTGADQGSASATPIMAEVT